jgi:SAM-dependent methyltransferase
VNSSAVESRYDETYFGIQREFGEFGAWAELPKFVRFIGPTDDVVDFGCGGGYLLHALPTSGRKIGLDVNPVARATAAKLGIETVASVDELADDSVDFVLSNHALEHCERPLDELRALVPKLRIGGRVLLCVPSETSHHRWHQDDWRNHLYTWSPMCLGNLCVAAGLVIDRASAYHHRWPPLYRRLARVGSGAFNLACRIYGLVMAHRESQVIVVAHKAG